jgi:hypothetical protein
MYKSLIILISLLVSSITSANSSKQLKNDLTQQTSSVSSQHSFLQLAVRGGPRGRPAHIQHNRPRAQPHRQPVQRHHNVHRAQKAVRYRTINGRRMRYYTAGAGIALIVGASCYVDNSGYGQITNSRCCIGSNCYTNFYID